MNQQPPFSNQPGIPNAPKVNNLANNIVDGSGTSSTEMPSDAAFNDPTGTMSSQSQQLLSESMDEMAASSPAATAINVAVIENPLTLSNAGTIDPAVAVPSTTAGAASHSGVPVAGSGAIQDTSIPGEAQSNEDLSKSANHFVMKRTTRLTADRNVRTRAGIARNRPHNQNRIRGTTFNPQFLNSPAGRSFYQGWPVLNPTLNAVSRNAPGNITNAHSSSSISGNEASSSSDQIAQNFSQCPPISAEAMTAAMQAAFHGRPPGNIIRVMRNDLNAGNTPSNSDASGPAGHASHGTPNLGAFLLAASRGAHQSASRGRNATANPNRTAPGGNQLERCSNVRTGRRFHHGAPSASAALMAAWGPALFPGVPVMATTSDPSVKNDEVSAQEGNNTNVNKVVREEAERREMGAAVPSLLNPAVITHVAHYPADSAVSIEKDVDAETREETPHLSSDTNEEAEKE